MYFNLVRPEQLPPDVLDDVLGNGWFRMRQGVFTCRYLLGSHGLHTAVWTRLDLRDYRPDRDHRRRMRRVERELQVDVVPFELTDEHADLYRRYRVHVGGDRADELHEVLYDLDDGVLLDDRSRPVPTRDVFDTWQVRMRDGERLVAFSCFDRGRKALQSVLGVYDPDYAKLGLGIASMLFEVAHGRDHGFHWHYAGYVVPGVPGFDYKRLVGPLQAWDPVERDWVPLAQVDEDELPHHRLQRALGAVTARLEADEIPCQLRSYPPYRLVHLNGLAERCMATPLYVECGEPRPGRARLALTWNPDSELYSLDAWTRDQDLSRHLPDHELPDDGPPAERHLLVRVGQAGTFGDPDQVVDMVRRAWRLGRRPVIPVR
ncbi:MAG: hypothetical protein H6742_08885 [Alphaproteobacteria bacterium]|nr:hypothetical protein [Alphaproteobacteria bacterium]